MSLTLRDLVEESRRDDVVERLLTLHQVAEVTGETYKQIKRWVYDKKVMPTVPYGPLRRPRVRASVVLQMFVPHMVVERRASGVRGTRYRPCGPSPAP